MVTLRSRLVVQGRQTPKQLQRRAALAKISHKWTGHRSSPSQGMHNPDTLCYRNAVLQALFHSPQFVNWLETDHGVCSMIPDDVGGMEDAPRCIACALRGVCVVYWARDSQPWRVTRALNELQVVLHRAGWTQRGQEDAAEFLGWLFLELRKQLPFDVDKLLSLLSIDLSDTVLCPACGHHSTTEIAPDAILGVTIAGPSPTLKKCVRAALKTVVPSVVCSGQDCNHQSDRWKTTTIDAAPSTLCVQLRRFAYNWPTKSWEKNEAPVAFAEALDLSQHLTVRDQITKLQYQLATVVFHRGTVEAGHYITIARGPDGRWTKINNQLTRRGSLATLKKAVMKKERETDVPMTPYMLFYEKVELQISEVAQKKK